MVADSQQRVRCKLWNSNYDVNQGDEFTLTNMVVDEFNDQKSLNSTDESIYTVCHLAISLPNYDSSATVSLLQKLHVN